MILRRQFILGNQNGILNKSRLDTYECKTFLRYSVRKIHSSLSLKTESFSSPYDVGQKEDLKYCIKITLIKHVTCSTLILTCVWTFIDPFFVICEILLLACRIQKQVRRSRQLNDYFSANIESPIIKVNIFCLRYPIHAYL